MSGKFVHINGELVSTDQASIHISDLAIQRGYGIFDFFKVVGGKPVFLDDHLNRFYRSALAMRLPVKQTPGELKQLIAILLEKNNLPDSGVRMTLTGGYSADGFNLAEPNLLITQQEFTINKEAALRGTRLVTYPHQRQFPDIKTIDYLMAIWLREYITENHADDVLYQHEGKIRECPRANIFIFTNDHQLLTPGRDILEGVIRKQVLKLTPDNYMVKETDISLEDLYHAKEVFITSSTKNILPVTQVDGRLIGDGKPGANTIALQNLLNKTIHQL